MPWMSVSDDLPHRLSVGTVTGPAPGMGKRGPPNGLIAAVKIKSELINIQFMV